MDMLKQFKSTWLLFKQLDTFIKQIISSCFTVPSIIKVEASQKISVLLKCSARQ